METRHRRAEAFQQSQCVRVKRPSAAVGGNIAFRQAEFVEIGAQHGQPGGALRLVRFGCAVGEEIEVVGQAAAFVPHRLQGLFEGGRAVHGGGQ